MKWFVLIGILLFGFNASAYTYGKLDFFEDRPLYSEPMAGIRSPDTGVTINTSKYKKERIGYLDVSLGRNLPIMTYQLSGDWLDDNLFIQLGLAGGFWATLGYDRGAFPLLTQDFLISIPLEVKFGNFSAAIKFNHISAHLGDGFDALLEENLSSKEKRDLDIAEDLLEGYTKDEDVGITLKEPFSYSRDFFSLSLSYEYRMGIFDGRTYWHGGYAHKMIPSELARSYVGTGTEMKYSSKSFAPYYATDVTYNQDTNSTDLSAELGAVVLAEETDRFSLRIAFTAFIGKDRRGQLIGNNLKQFGLGFFIY